MAASIVFNTPVTQMSDDEFLALVTQLSDAELAIEAACDNNDGNAATDASDLYTSIMQRAHTNMLELEYETLARDYLW